LIKNEILIIKF